MPRLYEDSALATAAHLLTHGPVSRAETARTLNLSAGTLTRLVKPLLTSGLVVEEGLGAPKTGMGRPTQLLDIPAHAHRFLGINITARAVHAVCVDARACVHASKYVAVDDTNVATVVRLVNDLIAQIMPCTQDSLRGVGISLGGAVRGGIVKENRFLGWRDIDFPSMLHLPAATPVTVTNDLEALTALEQWFGLGRHIPSFALVTVGAGVGHGLVHERHRLRAPTSGYGMTGHFPVAGAAGICQYGHISCANGALTVPALLGRARSGRGIAMRDHRPVDQEDLVALAHQGDATCRSVLEEFARNFATYIQAVACAAMVTDVVIDGEGVTLLDTVWASSFIKLLNTYRSPNIPPLTVHRRSGSFDRWAQGAATNAITAWLEDSVTRA
ncbi:ROK family protein [Schaalia suimastitidis]|uniref:ROK family protein n=1 Tax=Schaalia suimastitidis TaxID=121163 RepID=UPI00040BE412|nr:ROK family protein [Schaalia suimastitidis]